MQPKQVLSTEEIETIKRNILIAQETLDGLVDYERIGADVSTQRAKLQEVIDKSKKLLEVFGT